MKRILALCLALLISAVLPACGAQTPAQADRPTETPASAAAPAAEAPAPTPDETAAHTPEPSAAAKETPAAETPAPSAEPAPPAETPAPEDSPAPEADEPEALTPDELAEWIEAQNGDLTAILEGLQNFQLNIGVTPGENDVVYHELPAEYSFLLPEGLREGDFVLEHTDGYSVHLQNRSLDEFTALTERAVAAGYGQGAISNNLGISIYEGYLNGYALEIIYSAGTIQIARGLPDP